MKIVTRLVLSLSAFFAVCNVVPAPTQALLPFTVVAPELAAWLLIFHLLSAAILLCVNPRALPYLVIGGVFCAWPLVQVVSVERRLVAEWPAGAASEPPFRFFRSFTGVPYPSITPQRLPLGIRYYPPQGSENRLALIDIHGGAWQRGSALDDAPFHRFIASQGYAVFSLEYRLAPRWQFPAQIEDVRASLQFIYANAHTYHADSTRLVLCGRSAGAQLALLAAYENGAVPIAGAISLYGPTDLVRGYAELPKPDPIHARDVLTAYLGGSPSQQPDRYRAASAIQYAANRVPPTLLIQGSKDHVVKPEFARALHQKLRVSGNRCFLLELPWSEHSFDAVFSGPGNQLTLYAITAFLKQLAER